MGMLLYLMESQRNMAAGATEKVAPKPKKIEDSKKVEKKPEPEVKPEPEPAKKITRSDIMKMNVATVRAYAEEQGIKGANAMSGAELKRILGDKLFEDSESETETETE